MAKRHVYYYYDERNDDFAGTNIKQSVTPRDYKYYHPNIFYRIFKAVSYYSYFALCRLIFLFMGVKVRNKKVLKDLRNKKKGYFVYGNHTSFLTDALTPALGSLRQTSLICSPDAINIKGLKHFVRLLGAYPVPHYKETYVNFSHDLETLYDRGQVIGIYPEAHIWPHYSKIRDFADVSFYYPVKMNAPSFAKTTIYARNRRGKIKTFVYYDGPFYPDTSLSLNDAKADLCERIKNKMKERVTNFNSVENPKYTYVKVNDPSLVRTETVRVQRM